MASQDPAIIIPPADTVGSAEIENDSVANADLRNSAGLSVIGRSANSTGDPGDIVAANDAEVLRRAGTTLGFGTVATAGIADNAVTDGKLRDSAALSVIGRAANSSGDPADIAAANDAEVLRRSGTALGFGTVATAGLADNSVTYAKMQDVTGLSVVGRAASTDGDPAAVTGTDGKLLTVLGTALAFTFGAPVISIGTAGATTTDGTTGVSTGISFSVVAGAKYLVFGHLGCTSAGAGNAPAFAWLRSGGATLTYVNLLAEVIGSAVAGQPANTTSTADGFTAPTSGPGATERPVIISSLLTIDVAGTLTLQMRTTSAGNAVTMVEGACLLIRIA